jgi:Mitochondrial ATPase expression
MRGSVPSLGALSSFSPQSPSRIPHLKLHILARRPRPNGTQLPEWTCPPPRKCFHTTSSAHNLSGFFHGSRQRVVQPEDPELPAQDTHPPTDAQHVEAPCSTDESQRQQVHPELVLYALLSTADGRRFVAQASPTSFEAAFCRIDPSFMLDPFKEIYYYMKPSLATQPRYRWVRAIDERLASFAQQLNEVVNLRLRAHELTKGVCVHLLHCARVMGNESLARMVWQSLIPQYGLQRELDVHAYNCYTEAICWSNAFSKTEQWRLRVTPRILALRRGKNPPPDLSGHRAGPIGLRHETLVYFRRMVEQKLDGNEETFTNLMVAMGREGDLSGAKSILKSVYNIDVDLLLQLDEEEVETPTFYESDSPLRPTVRLLLTVAHVFGSNNDIVLAFKLVDFVSRQYDLRIPSNVWMHLYNWAFVLSIRRSSAKERQGQATGHVSYTFLDTLWTEMTDEPHNIKPDVVMYTHRARSMRDRGMLPESAENIQAARANFRRTRGNAQRLGEELLTLTDELLTSHRPENPQYLVPAEWLHLRRQFVLSSLVEDRDLQLLIVAVRLTLTEQSRPEHGYYQDWERRQLPNLIADFAEFLPNTLTYKTLGGRIEMTGLKSTRVAAAKHDMRMSMRNGLLRANVDRDIATMDDLLAAVRNFRAEIEDFDRDGAAYTSRRM